MIQPTLPIVDISHLRLPHFEDELWRIEDEHYLSYAARWDNDELSLSTPAGGAPELILITDDNRSKHLAALPT